MGKGGGKGIMKEAERGIRDTFRKIKKDPLGAAGDFFVRGMTADLVKMEDGKLDLGNAFHRFDEIIGEVSGRNAKRFEGYETAKRTEEAEALAKQQRADEVLARYRADLQASRMTQAVRDSGNDRSLLRPVGQSTAETLGGDIQQDILGA